MQTRDTFILANRGETLGSILPGSGSDEIFQNQTLRPILKLQNDLLVQVFINYAVKQKNVFFDLPADKKAKYIENAIQKDLKFRNSLKGIIIGMFTIQEYLEYIKNSSNLNKRMMLLLTERLKDNILLLQVI